MIVKALMSLYERDAAKVRVGSIVSDKGFVKVGAHQGSALSPLLFAVLMHVTTKYAKNGVIHEITSADDLVLMSESMENLLRKFSLWKV